ARLGDRVDGQRPLAVIHAKDENSWQEAAKAVKAIDYSVGFTEMARLGDRVDGQRPLAVIHAKDENSWQEAAKAVKA
ncbi:hypothetical protein CKQ90_35170, partial [Klebsiella pneumoniae]